MNIYLLQQELLSIYDELEENGGELTPELELQLSINADDVKDNIKDYVNLTKLINSDLANIAYEQKRLKDLADKKKKALEKVNNIILNAIDFFGETKKSGVKFIDYGTGVVSTRTSTAVEVNDNSVKCIGIALKEYIEWNKSINETDTINQLDKDELIRWISEDVVKSDNEVIKGIDVTEDDLNNVKVNVNFNVPLKALINGEKYDVIKHLVGDDVTFDVSTKVDKTDLKNVLKHDNEACPNVAKLVEHKNLVIK